MQKKLYKTSTLPTYRFDSSDLFGKRLRNVKQKSGEKRWGEKVAATSFTTSILVQVGSRNFGKFLSPGIAQACSAEVSEGAGCRNQAIFFDETMREEILEISPQKKQELAAKSNEYP